MYPHFNNIIFSINSIFDCFTMILSIESILFFIVHNNPIDVIEIEETNPIYESLENNEVESKKFLLGSKLQRATKMKQILIKK